MWEEWEGSPDREKTGRDCWDCSLADKSNWEGAPCSGLEGCEARRKEGRSKRMEDTVSSHQRVVDREDSAERGTQNWRLAGEDSQNSEGWRHKDWDWDWDWDWEDSKDETNKENSKSWQGWQGS